MSRTSRPARWTFALGLGMLGAACGEPASVLFVIDAHPIVRERAEELSFRSWGGHGEALELTTDEPFRPTRWPVLALIDPRDGDASRRWAFEVAVQDRGGRRFLARRVRGTFRPGEVRRVDLYLEPPCISDDGMLLCGDWYDDTCLSGECVPTPEDDGEIWDGDDPREHGPMSDGGMDAAFPIDERDGAVDAAGSDAALDDGATVADAAMDAATLDAAAMDAAAMDAAAMDAAAMDAGPPDAGPMTDAGECPCAASDPCFTTDCVGGRCIDTPIDCDDANPCTVDSCSGGACGHLDVTDGAACGSNTCCGGDCVDTTRDDAHCGVCGSACTDPTPACLSGSCASCSTASDCPAASACETVACSTGSCTYTLDAGWCRIGGACVANGVASATNPCALCNAARSTSAWSPAGSSVGCADDGVSCTLDRCTDSGTTCTHVLAPDRCRIGGTCYADGAANPSMGCERCDPGTSTSAWTARPDGFTGCGGPQTMCCASACAGTCTHGGSAYCDGAAHPTDSCRVCNGGTHAWDPRPDGTPCSGTAGSCGSGICELCDPPCGPGTCCTMTASLSAVPMCTVCPIEAESAE